jgi:Family of unknown function (DUF6166)
MTKTYVGKRNHNGSAVVRVIGRDGDSHALPARWDLDNHSPTGFEWGYGGSGPAQLALALIADALGDDQLALRLHQKFKWMVVAGLPKDHWRLTEPQVIELVGHCLLKASSNER